MVDKEKAISRAALFILAILLPAGSAAAGIEIVDFFSDFTSSDINVNSSHDFEAKAVFELLYQGNPVESHELPIKIRAGETAYKIIIWEKRPQHDYYLAKVSLYSNGSFLISRSYPVSYGTVTLPSFQVVDFSPTNSGVQLLLRPFNPSAVDIGIELLDNNDIFYSKMQEDVSLTSNTEMKITWPFLLANNKKYTVRVKIFTHRLYASPLINTYVADFTSTEDVEILPADVQVDEYGASVTVRGKSQVPFDGAIVVTANNRATNEAQTYSQQVEDILISGKESTAGVVWKGIAPGTYDVEIRAVNRDNVTIDKYETVLRIPDYPAASVTPPVKGTPGFEGLLLIMTLIIVSRRSKGA